MKRVKEADYLFLALLLIQIFVAEGISRFDIRVNMTLNQALVFAQSLIVVPGLIYLLIKRTNPFKFIRFKKVDIKTILMSMLFVMLIMPLITFVNAFSMLFTSNATQDIMAEMSDNPLILNLTLIALIPACVEELVFRGIIYNNYRKKGILYASVLSGLLFGLMHMNLNQLSYAFVIGIAFGFLLEATDSIITTIVGHFMINGNSVLLLYLLNKVMASMSGFYEEMGIDINEIENAQMTTEMLKPVILVYGIIAIFTTMLAIAVLIWIAKHNKTISRIPFISKIASKEDLAVENLAIENVKGSDEVYIEVAENQEKIRSIRPVLVISIVLCVAYMFIG